MSSKSLNVTEFEAVKQALIARRSEKGNLILGAQLGQVISKAIAPRQVRALPILRDLADEELSSLVELVPDASSNSDVQYRIIADQAPTSLTLDDLKLVAGSELWKFFSNPNQSCSLAIESSTGHIFVGVLRAIFPVGLQRLQRMDSEDYRVLAEQFAAQQDTPLREKLEECLEIPHFYDSWIDALRASGSAELKLLKTWESLRTEHVAKRLGERLTNAGVSVALQAEIISAARPRKRAAVAKQAPGPGLSSPSSPPRPTAHAAVSSPDDVALEKLRAIVHASVDRMSSAELREVRIPAGILLDAAQKRS